MTGINSRGRIGAALLAVTAIIVAAPAAANAADPLYGVSTASPLQDQDLAQLDDGGVQALRLEISWRQTQRSDGTLDWAKSDAVIGAAAEHGIEVAPYLTGIPQWARSCKQNNCHAAGALGPTDDSWLRFVAAAVNRYGPDGSFWPIASGAEQVTLPISHWQLWNTANDDGRTTSYGALLEATYRTIKLADPDAELVTGALSFAGGKGTLEPAKFLRGLLRTSGKNSFSAVGVRPLSRSVGSVKRQIKDVRRTLDTSGHVGDGIWVAPIGWASDRHSSKAMSVGPGGQKSRLRSAMKSLRHGLGVEGVFWARWRDGGGGCKWCKHSGLVRKSGKAKPAWGAYRKFLKTLAPPPPPPSDTDPAFFGVVPENGPLSAPDLALMDQAGVGAVRTIVSWRAVQPSDGAPYDWDELDDKFEALALHGIEILPQLFGPPDTVTKIDDQAMLGNWKAFVSAAVNRYKADSPFWQQFKANHPNATPQPPSVWQVYNEQNIWEFWPGGPSANKYAQLLAPSADAIRAADPTAQIMLGGMHGDESMNGTPSYKFLEQLYDYPGARANFDIVAVHPYAFSVDDMSREIQKVRDVMVANDDSSSPIWITEMGWASAGDGDPSRQLWWERDAEGQASMLTSAWNLLLENSKAWNLHGIFWYTWRDPIDDLCNFCSAAGLLKSNYTPKPSYAAFEALTPDG